MAKEKKALCKWDKDEIRDKMPELRKIVATPAYICRKCARAAREEEYLCKPEKL